MQQPIDAWDVVVGLSLGHRARPVENLKAFAIDDPNPVIRSIRDQHVAITGREPYIEGRTEHGCARPDHHFPQETDRADTDLEFLDPVLYPVADIEATVWGSDDLVHGIAKPLLAGEFGRILTVRAPHAGEFPRIGIEG